MKTFTFFLTFFFLTTISSSQIITTFAGGGTTGLGDGGPATAAEVSDPFFGVFDKYGNYYYSDYSGYIRKVNTADIITTYAGPGTYGVLGDGGPATAASFRSPEGITCDTFGNLYIADEINFRIRKIDAITGIISTIAGIGTAGSTGDGGPATLATIFPADVHFDKKGNLYISDYSHKIRKINNDGIITTFAGTGTAGFGGDGGAATNAELNGNVGITFDNFGNLYIVDAQNKRVRKIDTLGIITTIAGTGTGLYSGDSIPATNANFGPYGCIAVDKYNNLYVDDSNQRIREIDTLGIIHTITGTGIGGYNGENILADTAEIIDPSGIAFDACGNLYFGDVGNHLIRKITFFPSCKVDSIDSLVSLNTDIIHSNARITIYPNPTATNLTITANTQINKITITNVIGQTVYDREYNAEKAALNIGYLPEGVYMVAVIDGEGNKVVRKVVKE